MREFILGMTLASMQTENDIVEFSSKEQAENESQEWCVVRAASIDEAKEMYVYVYEAWYLQGFKGDYPDFIIKDGIKCMATEPFEPYNKEISGQ